MTILKPPNWFNLPLAPRMLVRPGDRIGLSGRGGESAPAADIYVNASTGDDGGTGAVDDPFETLEHALSVAGENDVIALQTNVALADTAQYTGYTISTAGLTIKSDTPGTRRIIDMSAMDSGDNDGGDGISLTGADQTLVDLHFTGYAPFGSSAEADYVAAVNVRGTGFTAQNCAFSDCAGRGMALGENGTPTNAAIVNCDFYNCIDPNSSSPYGNADGLQVFCESGHTGITIDGCRFLDNSDDGIDLFYAQAPVTITDCWAFRNGYQEDGTTLGGNGVGFKLGGGTYSVAHSVSDCLAFDNAGSGFSMNDNYAAATISRCTAINNGNALNGYPASFIADGDSTVTLEDCVKYGGEPNYLGGSVTESYNSWNDPPDIGEETVAWFGENFLDDTDMDGARQSNGDLPDDLNYGRPAIGSVLLTNGHSGGVMGWTGTALEAAGEEPAASAAFTLVGSSANSLAVSGNNTIGDVPGAQAADLMVGFIAYRGAANFALPAGWTLIKQETSGNTDVDQTTNIASILLCYIVRGASAPALVWTRTAGDVSRGCIVAYRPASGTISVVDSSSNTLSTAGTTATTGSLTTDVDDCLVVAAMAVADNWPALQNPGMDAANNPSTAATSEKTDDPAANTWLLRNSFSTTNGADVSGYIADGIMSTAGATGTISCATSGINARHAMAAVAFKAV